MTKRIIYRVRWDRPSRLWFTRRGHRIVSTDTLKRVAVIIARMTCRRVWANGRLAQLVVHGQNGRIQREATYRRDPRRRKG